MKKVLLMVVLFSTVLSSAWVTAAPYHGREMIFRLGMNQMNPSDTPSQTYWNGVPKDSTITFDEGESVNFTFQYFINRSWAMELMMAFPMTNDIRYQGFNSKPSDEDPFLGEATHVPTAFSFLYYPDKSWKFKPYAGFGAEYSFFYGEKISSSSGNFFRGLSVDDVFSLTAQAGADYQVTKNWSLNFSARYVDMETAVNFLYRSGTRVRSKVDLNPVVYSLMIGYKF